MNEHKGEPAETHSSSAKYPETDWVQTLADAVLRRSNDAVKLAYLTGDDLTEQIDGLDLSLLSEFKRNANGSVEIKLIDRIKAIRELSDLLHRTDGGGGETAQAAEFYRALERRAGEGAE